MTSLTVSGRVAQVLSSYLSDVFGVMGNGNVYFLDAAEKLGLRFSAVRHEGAAIAAADAYYRTSGRLAAGTTTYGPGYTNALTASPSGPGANPRRAGHRGRSEQRRPPQDVDQAAIAAGLGAATFTVTRDAAGSITRSRRWSTRSASGPPSYCHSLRPRGTRGGGRRTPRRWHRR